MEEKELTKKERRALRRQEKKTKRKQQEKKRLFSRITLWSFVLVAVLGIIIGIAKLSQQSPDSDNLTASLSNPIVSTDHIKGNEESDITLIEYSDFQCPACGQYYPIIKQLYQEFGSSMNFVYRHLPLRQIHPNAEMAARASEAAGKQNKFWEMHDLLFEGQMQWSNQLNPKGNFIEYAKALELDIEQFKNDLDSKDIKEKVNNDYKDGVGLGIQSVPSFFLNGKKLSGLRSYEDFSNIIQQAISNNQP